MWCGAHSLTLPALRGPGLRAPWWLPPTWSLHRERRPDGPHPSHPYLFGDVAVLVNVIEVKGPLELLLDCSSKEDGKANHKVLGGKKGEE